jgi:hypothetical protein
MAVTLLRFELVNPSDPFTFTASSLEVAAQAVLLIGEGTFGGKSLDGGTDVPIFIFGRDPDPWFQENFGKTAEESFDTRDDNALAECFESFTLGRERATSLNDIGGRAKQYAEALRAATGSAT